jgi:hypothetical protein
MIEDPGQESTPEVKRSGSKARVKVSADGSGVVYPHLKAQFEDQLANGRPTAAPAHESALALLGEFKILALSRLAAQHEEIKRLRAGAAATACAAAGDRPMLCVPKNACYLDVCAEEAIGSVPARGGWWPVCTRAAVR